MIGNINLSRSFGSTLQYILKRNGVSIVYDNVGAVEQELDHKAIAQTMRDTAELNYRTSKPCFHLSISPASSDELNLEDWEDLTADLLSFMNLRDRQAIAVLHTDEKFPSGKPRPHVHIVGNLIDNEGNRANTDFSKYRLQEAIRKLESDYELTPTASSWEVDKRRDTPGQVHRLEAEWAEFERGFRSQEPSPTVRRQIQDALDQAPGNATSFEELGEILANASIETRFTPQGWKLQKDGVWLAGYQLGKRYTQTAIGKQLENNLTNNVVSQGREGLPSLPRDEPAQVQKLLQNEDESDDAAQSPEVTNNVVSQEQEKEQLARQYQYYRKSLTDDQQSLPVLERDRAIACRLLADGYESKDAAVIVAQSPDIQKHPDYSRRLSLTQEVINPAVERHNQELRRKLEQEQLVLQRQQERQERSGEPEL